MLSRISMAVARMLLAPVPALALAAALVSAAAAQGVIAEKAISLDLALAVARGALEKCRAEGYRVAVTVVDRDGLVKASLRDDGTGPHALDASRREAFTALTFKVLSGDWAERVLKEPAASGLKDTEGTLALRGGVPIRAGTEVIGAVGTSGAPDGDKDEACSQAGLLQVAGRLR
jgi:uncharacterized protein GlcG (DUF336 family)